MAIIPYVATLGNTQIIAFSLFCVNMVVVQNVTCHIPLSISLSFHCITDQYISLTFGSESPFSVIIYMRVYVYWIQWLDQIRWIDARRNAQQIIDNSHASCKRRSQPSHATSTNKTLSPPTLHRTTCRQLQAQREQQERTKLAHFVIAKRNVIPS